MSLFVNLNAQIEECFSADETVWNNPFLSCEKSNNPNPTYGETHWLKYNFSEIRNLSLTRIWNVNQSDILDYGAKDISFDYSVDGINWTHWGQVSINRGTGDALYPGDAGPDLTGVKAQFVLLTLHSNYSSEECVGLTQVKFYFLPGFEEGVLTSTTPLDKNSEHIYTISPNPANDIIYLSGTLNSGKRFSILNALGQQVKSGMLSANRNYVQIEELQTGIYYLVIDDVLYRFTKID